MRWERVTIVSRLVCLLFGVGGVGVAGLFYWVSSSGIETVPPLFILLAVLGALLFLFIAVVGRYPAFVPRLPERKRE
jgi:hypothetical protein